MNFDKMPETDDEMFAMIDKVEIATPAKCGFKVVSDEGRGGWRVECERHGWIAGGIAEWVKAEVKGLDHVAKWRRIDADRAKIDEAYAETAIAWHEAYMERVLRASLALDTVLGSADNDAAHRIRLIVASVIDESKKEIEALRGL